MAVKVDIQSSTNIDLVKVKELSKEKDEDKEKNSTNEPAAIFEKTGKIKQGDFTYKIDMDVINRMKSEMENQMLLFQNMMKDVIVKQGYTVEEVLSALERGENPEITIDDETKQEAQQLISEDGYWGIKETSTRILDFAKEVAGGDVSKLAEIKKGIEKGFKDAEKVFGGSLPDISYKTYDTVMKGFKEWEEEMKVE